MPDILGHFVMFDDTHLSHDFGTNPIALSLPLVRVCIPQCNVTCSRFNHQATPVTELQNPCTVFVQMFGMA